MNNFLKRETHTNSTINVLATDRCVAQHSNIQYYPCRTIFFHFKILLAFIREIVWFSVAVVQGDGCYGRRRTITNNRRIDDDNNIIIM